MHHDIFTELSIIIAIGSGVALIMRLLHQPLIIGHIFTGIVVGPSALSLINNAETIEVFSKIGIALLLFIIGLGLNPRVIREVGKVTLITGTVQVVLTAAAGVVLGLLFGLTKTESVVLGTALSFSSTIIILKLLSDKKEQSRLYGKIAVGILLLQDILATVALLVFTAQTGNHGFEPSQLLTLLGKGLLIGTPLVLIGNVVLPRLHKLIAGSQEFLFLFSIGWGFGGAALFEYAGFSLEVGALFAGVSLATLPYAQEISARLRPLRDFFVVVFFINLGATLNFSHLSDIVPLVIASTMIVIFFKPLTVLVTMGILGYTKRTSFKTAVSLAQISEFSLVLSALAISEGKIGENLAAALTIVALVTIAYSTYASVFDDGMFDFFEKHFILFERAKAHNEQRGKRRKNYELVLFGYQRGGHEFVKVFKALKRRFVVIDYDPDIIDELEHAEIEYLYGDASDHELLEEADLSKARMIVSTITDFDVNKSLVRTLEKLNPNAVFITHADNIDEAAELYEMGV
ncbi:cation:proton antiporter, partial [Candidatus Saccharibacteria bacterium]|nr:cation:proton antiporter [Candidatus Saccharibacteria bacterium]